MAQTLAALVRAKHPGVYDDLSDADLESKVRAKFPGVYDDLPTTPADDRSMPSRAADAVVDVGIGAAKGAANTIGGLGQLARKIPGVNQLDRLMTPIPVNTTPENTAQQIGMGAEQIGEFFVPGMAAGGRVAQAAKAAGLTLAQTGSPATAGVSGALTAVLPGASAAQRAAGALKGSAEKTMAQALGATKEGMKADAARLAPQMLERGVKGSRAAMLDQAKGEAARVGAALDDAYAAAAAAGETVSGQTIRQHLKATVNALRTTDASGAPKTILGTERVVQKLTELDDFVASFGDDIPVDKAAAVKRTWDHIISKAGLFGPKATASATDSADAWAIREASGAFRSLLNESPTLAALNKEAAFWTGLKKVLSETQRRTQAQSGGLVSGIAGAAGAGSGFASGDSMGERMGNAVLGGMAGRQLVKGMQSAWWRTTAAGPAKAALAEALASGNAGKLVGAISKVTQAVPAQLAGQAP